VSRWLRQWAEFRANGTPRKLTIDGADAPEDGVGRARSREVPARSIEPCVARGVATAE